MVRISLGLWCAWWAGGALVASEIAESKPLWWISPHEGGGTKLRHQQALSHWLADRGCPVRISQTGADKNDAALVFEVRPLAAGVPWMVADTEGNQPLTVRWLVKGSRSVKHLASLEGERVALLGKASLLGHQQPVRLLEQAGVTLTDVTVFTASKYQGAMALLLHGDVFAAAFPAPLATKWSKLNDLVTLAESDASLVAGVWLSSSTTKLQWMEEGKQGPCAQGLLAMSRASRRDAKMQVFPEWLTGFRWPNQR